MAVYELSIDGPMIREAEKVASLEGRGYPTLVMRWESRFFDQPWTTTLVLDYAIALPPLMLGQATFNEVRVAAYVGNAPTKFLYFGTEMSANVPRVAPEMENSIAPGGSFQEFRLEEQTCPIPYLKLIQVTPRIYGNGAQDYYSPPIKVERYDGAAGPQHLADFFPRIVANLDPVAGTMLTDPAQGLWNGARFAGTTAIAILRQGKVVGLHQRVGRTDKDPIPPEIRRRDPSLDTLTEWVAIDLGAASTVVALRGERTGAEIVRIGASTPVVTPRDLESPSEIAFDHVGRAVKAWRDRVILPLVRWDDVVVGQAARDRRLSAGPDRLSRAAAAIAHLPLLRERIERKEAYRLRGLRDPDTTESLKRPAPPVIDEDGIGAHDPFDPLELYAYHVGLTVNHRARGLHTRYAVSMPTGWPAERRQSALMAFRRGVFRSLPAGLLEFHDLEALHVVDAGPSALTFSAYAFRAFGLKPQDEPVRFCAIDAGASETGIIAGVYRQAREHEMSQGHDRVIEYLAPGCVPWLGGERLLARLAYRLWAAHRALMEEARTPIERPLEEEALEGATTEELLLPSPEARANSLVLCDLLRPLLEAGAQASVPEQVDLLSLDGQPRPVPLTVDLQEIRAELETWLDEGVERIREYIAGAVEKIGRGPDLHDGVRILLGGRLGMHPFLQEQLEKALPPSVKIHRFKEPDRTNLGAPTVKTAAALGILAMKAERIGAWVRSEQRDSFRYRVGRGRHGQLADALDPTVDYDQWREMGACSKPELELLFMPAEDEGEVASDDPRVKRARCDLGFESVGLRLYARAVGPARVEVSVGPPGGEPAPDAVCFGLDLDGSVVERIRS